MTAKGILDHSARVEKLLTKLNFIACKLNKQVQSLSKQVTSQSRHVKNELDKVKNPPRKFVPLFDQRRFYQWNENRIDKFNVTILRVAIGIGQYERILHKYHVTIVKVRENVFHG